MPVFGVARTIVDVFRYRNILGLDVGLKGLREALRKRKVTPAEVTKLAIARGAWKIIEPYMAALTIDS